MNMYLLQHLLKNKKTLPLIITTTAAMVVFVWNYDLQLIVPMITLTPNKLWVLRVGMTLILIVMFLIALLLLSAYALKKSISNKNEINLHEFTFVDPPGYYTHPEYSYPICPICLIKKNLKSPVSNGHCTVCKEPISETLVSGGEVFTVPYRDV